MSDELPEIFERLTIPAAPAELRPRVLAAVNQELAPRRKPRWERAFELASAASLLIGISVTVWQWRAEQERESRRFESHLAESGPNRDPLATADPQLTQLFKQRTRAVSVYDNGRGFHEQQARLLQEIAALNGG